MEDSAPQSGVRWSAPGSDTARQTRCFACHRPFLLSHDRLYLLAALSATRCLFVPVQKLAVLELVGCALV